MTKESKAEQLARTQKPGSWLKWLAIGTVAFFALVFVTGIAVIYYLSPIVVVDQEHGRVALFGGAINLSVDKDLAHVRIGGVPVGDAFKEGEKVSGEADFGGRNVRLIRIPFNTAKLELVAGAARRLQWACTSTTGDQDPKVEYAAGVATLNLDQLNIARCLISLPAELAAEISGVNGNMDVKNPSGDLDIHLSNGKVNIAADPLRTYDFEVTVKNGLQDFFPRSKDKDAVKVRVSVVNGMVKKK